MLRSWSLDHLNFFLRMEMAPENGSRNGRFLPGLSMSVSTSPLHTRCQHHLKLHLDAARTISPQRFSILNRKLGRNLKVGHMVRFACWEQQSTSSKLPCKSGRAVA